MVKLPKEVLVGGHKVALLPGAFTEMDCFGQYWRAENQIQIATDVDPSQQSSALLHEILHAVFAEAGLRQQFDDKQEEAIVQGMEPLLFQVLKTNPKVARFILK